MGLKNRVKSPLKKEDDEDKYRQQIDQKIFCCLSIKTIFLKNRIRLPALALTKNFMEIRNGFNAFEIVFYIEFFIWTVKIVAV